MVLLEKYTQIAEVVRVQVSYKRGFFKHQIIWEEDGLPCHEMIAL